MRRLAIVLLGITFLATLLSFVNFCLKLDSSMDRIALHFGLLANWVISFGIAGILFTLNNRGDKH